MSEETVLNQDTSTDNIVLPSDEQVKEPITDTPVTQADDTPQENTPGDVDKPAETETVTKIDVSAYEKEFAENGSLSEASYKALEDVGIPKEIVDRYIEGRTAYTQNYDEQVMAVAGGKSEYEQLVKWASENLSETEKLSYNKAATSGDIELAKLATAGLVSKYRLAGNQVSAKTFEGETGGTSLSVYNSMSELVVDQKDERYKTDRRYRQAIEDKVKRSIEAGTL